jgi:hypothetical protein
MFGEHYETVSSFDGNIRCAVEMESLIASQFTALQEVLHIGVSNKVDIVIVILHIGYTIP